MPNRYNREQAKLFANRYSREKAKLLAKSRRRHSVCRKKLSAKDSQRYLAESMDKYLQGLLTQEELKKRQAKYETDYNAATLALSGIKQQVKHEMRQIFLLISSFCAKILKLVH